MLRYFCCEGRRRNAVRGRRDVNGIDFLEVFDPGNPDPEDAPEVAALKKEFRQRRLFVYFLNDLSPGALGLANVVIEGGERLRDIQITRVETVDAGMLPFPEFESPIGQTVLLVDVAEPGDFSTYTLRLIKEDSDLTEPRPPDGFDPILSAVDFSFKVACPSDFDCAGNNVCPPVAAVEPEINYLAKDYASFRQVMLDRLAVVAPGWQTRLAADLGMALVELLAYVGDYLSYRQDAVATEAYLRTARRRISVRRHARLVDYRMHDGCNARVWLHLKLRDDIDELPFTMAVDKKKTRFLTRVSNDPSKRVLKLDDKPYEQALEARAEVFEPLHEITLRAIHNEMQFHTWGELECCLPKGATRASLVGRNSTGKYVPLKLQAGDVLILQEVKGPETGHKEDADPAHRHAVRLIKVSQIDDPLGDLSGSPPGSIPVTEIEWHEEDALPFPLCISAPGLEDVSVALGNIVLADHGLSVEGEQLPDIPIPAPELNRVIPLTAHCQKAESKSVLPRYRPRLQAAQQKRFIRAQPLTCAARFEWDTQPDAKGAFQSAAALFRQAPEDALPQVQVEEAGHTDLWEPVRDLLASGGDTKEFVVETENDGSAWLRFGDDQFGSRPRAGAELTAHYRVGNGSAGNVGPETIVHIASADPNVVTELSDPLIQVMNPLAASGGVEPESLEEVRRKAPTAFRRQERAVTLDDYRQMAHRCDAQLQSAAATSRWTGSWHTIFLTVDRMAGKAADAVYERNLRDCIEKYRMAGHDLEVDLPRSVPLELEMIVCVQPGYFRSHVNAAILERFSNRLLPDGTKGVFHPDNFSLGETVFLSPFYKAAQGLAGVASVEITRFARQDNPEDRTPLDTGKLELERLEVARLDNDPNFPERGRFVLKLRGGK